MKSLFDSLKRRLKDAKVDKLIRKLLAMEDKIPSGVINNLQDFSHEEITHALKEAYPSLESYLQKQLLVVLEDQGYMKIIYDKLNNGSEKEILYSLELLALLKPFKALDLIFRRLADNRESIRFEAAHTLILYKNKKVLELAVKELKQNSPYLPARLAQILMGYGSLAVLELINNLNNPEIDNSMIADILILMSDETIDKKVAECLASTDVKTRIGALMYFTKQKDAKNMEIFSNALMDSDAVVRAQAIKGLKGIGAMEAANIVQKAHKCDVNVFEQAAATVEGGQAK
ncbi:MAG: hypothetical protein KGZ94_10095 [Clostridia bacterium]|nr:hypothetical protein [Clostridia bacterium]